MLAPYATQIETASGSVMRGRATRVEILPMAAFSVVSRLPQALAELKLDAAGAGAGVWVAAPKEAPQQNGAPGWECAVLRKDGSTGREAEVGVLLIQPLSTGLNSETYMEFPGNVLGQDFGTRLERMITRHRKSRQVKRANRACELHHRPGCPAGCIGPCPSPPAPSYHGTSQLHLRGSARSRRAAARIVARARSRNTPILLPFKRQPCADLGAATVNLGPTVSSLNAARYNTHSQHEWSQILVGNFVEERERAVGAPEMNFAPWGSGTQAVKSNAGPHDAARTDVSAGTGGDTMHMYARGNRRPDAHDTRYLTAAAVDVPLQPDANSLGTEGYRLRRSGWPQEKQALDPRAAAAGAYRRPRAGGSGAPTDASTTAGDPWYGRVESLEAERLAQKDVTIVQHLQWPASASVASATATA